MADASVTLLELCKKKKAELSKNSDPFFSTQYFDNENVIERFLMFCHSRASVQNDQSKSFVGIIQATLSGKTRLIIESSYHHPIIMISFKKSNNCYHNMLSSFEREKMASNFQEALLKNRKILLKIKLFFLSYMQFMDSFLQVMNKTIWVDIEPEDKKVFNALLLNGGNDLIYAMYEQNVNEFGVDALNIQNNNEILYSEIKTKIHSTHKELFSKLRVYFALDECHVPLSALSGMLFHSDYKDHKEEDVFAWSQYEQVKDTNHGRILDGYPYTKASNLFNIIRFVLEEYLIQFGQMTIFASTVYSTWGPILDKNTYTREKIDISQFSDLPILTKENMVAQLNILNVLEEDRQQYKIYELIDYLVGRPGLFYEWCYTYLLPAMKLYSNITTTIEQKVQGLFRHVVNNSKIIEKLYFISLFKNNNIEVLSREETEEVLKAGVGYKTDSRVAIEGIIQKQILKNSVDMDSKKMQNIMKSVVNRNEDLAEIAAMYSIIQLHRSQLPVLIKKWKPDTPVNIVNAVAKFSIAVQQAFFINDSISKGHRVTEIFNDEKFWTSVIGSRPGLRMPDLIFSCDYNESEKCLVAVQMKLHGTKLSETEFDNAISSISVDKMFFGHNSLQHEFSGILKSWRESKHITFLRIIVCFAGFTNQQIRTIDRFNEEYSSQPILLVSPTSQLGENIFGDVIFDYLCEKMGFRPKANNLENEDEVEDNFKTNWILFEVANSNDLTDTSSLGSKRKLASSNQKPSKKQKQ